MPRDDRSIENGLPETPDFDQIARQFFDDYVGYVDDPTATLAAISEQLRLAWNARGAADAQAVEHRLRELVAGEIIGRRPRPACHRGDPDRGPLTPHTGCAAIQASSFATDDAKADS